jgi:excisionase family DNA binding protein
MTAPTLPDRLLNIAELAEYLGVPFTWVRDKVTARALPHTRVGRHVRFAPVHIAAIVAAGEEPALNGPLATPRARKAA